MTLQFPTAAEKAAADFETRRKIKTTSLSTVCMEHGAMRNQAWPNKRVFLFDDDTSLVATGAGRNLRYETFLP